MDQSITGVFFQDQVEKTLPEAIENKGRAFRSPKTFSVELSPKLVNRVIFQVRQPLLPHASEDNRRGQNLAQEREPQSRGHTCLGSGLFLEIYLHRFNTPTINHINHNHELMPVLSQVQKLEAKKLEEILRNPETANAKNLLLSISKEILNPEMAAFASSYQTIRVKLRRRLKKMNKVSAEVDH